MFQKPNEYFKLIEGSSLVWITIINIGYVNYTRNFLRSMELHGVRFTLIVYCLDKDIPLCLEEYKNVVCMDASYFIKGSLDPSLTSWSTPSYKHLVFSKLDALKYTLDLSKKNNIQFVGYIDTDIIVLKDPVPIILNSLIEDQSLDIVNQCDELTDACSNSSNCLSMSTGVIVFRSLRTPSSIFEYCSGDILNHMSDQDYIMRSIDNLGLKRLSISKDVFLNGMFPNLTTSEPLILPNTARLIHFNCMVGNEKQAHMKSKNMWYI